MGSKCVSQYCHRFYTVIALWLLLDIVTILPWSRGSHNIQYLLYSILIFSFQATVHPQEVYGHRVAPKVHGRRWRRLRWRSIRRVWWRRREKRRRSPSWKGVSSRRIRRGWEFFGWPPLPGVPARHHLICQKQGQIKNVKVSLQLAGELSLCLEF